MANKKPLVFGSDGRPEELHAEDTLDAAVSEKDMINLTNKAGSGMTIGQPVYVSGNGEMQLARANASGTKNVIGLVAQATIANDASGLVQTDGVITATTGDWDAITGGSGGLVANSEYWLSAATAGQITTTVPGSPHYLTRIGTALSTTELEISLQYVGKKA